MAKKEKSLPNITFGKLIEEIRKIKGLRQYQCAGMLGVTPAQWSVIESGHSGVNIDQIVKISSFLEINLITLLIKFAEYYKYPANPEIRSTDEEVAILVTKLQEIKKQRINSLLEKI